MSDHRDPSDPIRALERIGVRVHREPGSTTTGVAIAGVTAASATRWRVDSTYSLPRPCRVKATFAREKLKHRLGKLFKEELQAGDAEFDALVFITTDTPAPTAELLQDAEFRQQLQSIVKRGGHVTIDDTEVVIRTVGVSRPAADPVDAVHGRMVGIIVQRAMRGIADGNLFATGFPESGEEFDTLRRSPHVRVERIVSAAGATTPESAQSHDEWVTLLRGRADLEIAGQCSELLAGDHVFIAAGQNHRVVATHEPSIWLAVHFEHEES